MLWWRGLLPRIAAHLPAGQVLEIGPGFGRWTQHLLTACNHLTAVDLTERCIAHCRRRFAMTPRFEAWTNDGKSLVMIPENSLDFVFSFDALVHAEAPILRAYLLQLGQKLKPGGTGFIHHSNLRAFVGENGTLPSWLARRNWRAESMSARLFREYCTEAGLQCVSQEIINWVSRSRRADRHRISGAGLPLTDVLSTFERPESSMQGVAAGEAIPTKMYLNPRFADEFREIVVLATLYGRPGADATPLSAPRRPPNDPATLVARIMERMRDRADHLWSYLRDHGNALRVRRHEPVLNAVRRQRCPDCARALTSHLACASCTTEYVL